MASLTENLGLINTEVGNIKSAILEKLEESGSNTTNFTESSTLSEFDDAIKAIEITSGTTFSNGTKFAYSTWSTIPDNIVEWIEDGSKIKVVDNMFYNTKLKSATLNLTAFNDVSGMFQNCSDLTTVTLSSLGWTTCDNMFNGCTSLTDVNITGTISYVTTTKSMFENTGLTNLVSFSLGANVKTCDNMYRNSALSGNIDPTNILPIYNIVSSATAMFSECAISTLTKELYLNNCTNCSYMFYVSQSTKKTLKSTSNIYTENCTNMSYMFSGQSSLQTIGGLYLTKCQYATDMFKGCNSLVNITFYGLDETPLTTLDLRDTLWGSSTTFLSNLDNISGVRENTLTIRISEKVFSAMAESYITAWADYNITITT